MPGHAPAKSGYRRGRSGLGNDRLPDGRNTTVSTVRPTHPAWKTATEKDVLTHVNLKAPSENNAPLLYHPWVS
eukprot:2212369-Amphidinium_carterae.1